MHPQPKVIAFLAASPADLINLAAVSSVFSYPEIGGKPVYVSKILSMNSSREVRGRDGITLGNCIPYTDYSGPIDTLVILGGESAFASPPAEIYRWIRERAAQARRIAAVEKETSRVRLSAPCISLVGSCR